MSANRKRRVFWPIFLLLLLVDCSSKELVVNRLGEANVLIAEVDTQLDATQEQLLAALRKKRIEIAREEKIPAYIVFSDRTLTDMAVRRPASLQSLAGVKGVGEMKLARYGEMFLAVIRNSEETEAA